MNEGRFAIGEKIFVRDGMNNQVFIVFDSLRWDVFEESDARFLKGLGKWKKAYTPGTYTLPAHMSFFIGKLPTTFDGEELYDTVAIRYDRKKRTPYRKGLQLWRLSNPESPRSSHYMLEGRTIIEGFRQKGFCTIGTGGVNWFNPDLPAGKYLTEHFEWYRFFGKPQYDCNTSADYQLEWVFDVLQKIRRPYFLFINFGETHHRFVYRNCSWYDSANPYGDSRECRRRQRMCIEYLSTKLEKLLTQLRCYDLVMCSDHGEAMGEGGLWGHGFYHTNVMEVPLLMKRYNEIVQGDNEIRT